MIDKEFLDDLLLEYIDQYNILSDYFEGDNQIKIGMGFFNVRKNNELLYYSIIDDKLYTSIYFVYHIDNQNIINDIYQRFSKKLDYYKYHYETGVGGECVNYFNIRIYEQ